MGFVSLVFVRYPKAKVKYSDCGTIIELLEKKLVLEEELRRKWIG